MCMIQDVLDVSLQQVMYKVHNIIFCILHIGLDMYLIIVHYFVWLPTVLTIGKKSFIIQQYSSHYKMYYKLQFSKLSFIKSYQFSVQPLYECDHLFSRYRKIICFLRNVQELRRYVFNPTQYTYYELNINHLYYIKY